MLNPLPLVRAVLLTGCALFSMMALAADTRLQWFGQSAFKGATPKAIAGK